MAYLHARREKLGGYLPARVAQARAARHARGRGRSRSSRSRPPARRCRPPSPSCAWWARCSRTRCSASASCRSSPTRRAPSAWPTSSARSASTRPSASSTSPRTRRSSRTTRKRSSGQILEEGINEAGAHRLVGRGGHQLLGARRRRCCRCTSTTRCSASSAWATRSGPRPIRARAASCSAPPRGAPRSRARGCSTRTAPATSSPRPIPNCRAYDPCFAYELAVILEDGMRRMLAEQEDVFYYVTLMNESYAHAVDAGGRARRESCAGMYRVRAGAKRQRKVRLLGAGTILQRSDRGRGAAREGLGRRRRRVFGDELHRAAPRGDGIAVMRRVGGNPGEDDLDREAAAAQRRAGRRRQRLRERGRRPDPPVDRAIRYVALGTDGFGRSDTRANLRRFFEVDRHAIAVAALVAIDAARRGGAPASTASTRLRRRRGRAETTGRPGARRTHGALAHICRNRCR